MPNQIRDVERQQLRVTGNGRYIDRSSPEIAGANAAAGAKAAATFLDSVLKVGFTNENSIYKSYVDGKVKQQVAGVLSDQKLLGGLRSGDPVASAAVRSLMPQAQDTITRSLASAAGQSFAETYGILTARDAMLNGPKPAGISDDEWQRQTTERRLALRQEAAKTSGFNSLPTWAQGEVAAQVLAAQGLADNKTFSNSILAGDKTLRDNATTALGGTLLGVVSEGDNAIQADQQLASSGAIKPGEAPNTQAFGQSLVARLQAQISQLELPTNGTSYTKSQIMEVVSGGVLSTFNGLAAGNTYQGLQKAVNLLDLAGIAFGPGGAKFADGQEIGSYRLPDGSTLGDVLAAKRLAASNELERLETKEQMKNVVAPELAKALADPNYSPQLGAQQILAITKDPALAMQFFGWGQNLSEAQRRGTPAQQAEAERLEIEASRINTDPAQLEQRILAAQAAGKITLGQTAVLLQRNSQGAHTDSQHVSLAAEKARDLIRNSAAAITGARVGRLPADQRNDENRNKDWLSRAEDEAERAVTKMTNSQVAKLRAEGKEIKEDDYSKMFEKNLRDYTNSWLKKIKAGDAGGGGATFESKVMEEVHYAAQKLRISGGAVQMATFSPATIAAAKAKGIPLNPTSLSKYLVDRMGYITVDDDGKTKSFTNAPAAWRQMIEDARTRTRRQGGSGGGAQSFEGGGGGGGDRSLPMTTPANWWENLLRNIGFNGAQVSQAPPARPAGGDSTAVASAAPARSASRTAPTSTPGTDVLGAALNSLLGVQPASAAGLDTLSGQRRNAGGASPGQGLVNPQNYPAMAAIWRGQTRVSATTPGLPQVNAAQPMAAVPLAINSVNHPFFVAIGINEGTRTANGGFTRNYQGHTDPGNGVRNVGTIAAQQGGTPQAADRRWAGILSQTSIAMAPVLRRLGLSQGTVGFNRVMFNILDLKVQAPAAVPDFIRKLPGVVRAGATIEAIAKARADSFINPATGRLDTTFRSYTALLRDQRSRAGTFDYSRRT